MPAVSSEGGCLCGAIRYRASGPCSNSMICHCRTCRRVGAAPAVAWATFPANQFSILRGRPVEYRSSANVQRTFCGECGTALTYMHSNEPEFIDVTTCSLDEPDAFPPTHHSWLSHDVAWVKFGDGLPTFPQSRYEDPA
jgi:hypothetical protein